MCTLSTPGTRRSRGGGTRPPEPVARGDGKAHAMRARHARTTTTRTVVLSLLNVEARGVRVPRGGVARSSSPERAKYPESVPSAGRRIAKTSVVRSRRASVTRPRAVRVAARSEEGDSAPSEPTALTVERKTAPAFHLIQARASLRGAADFAPAFGAATPKARVTPRRRRGRARVRDHVRRSSARVRSPARGRHERQRDRGKPRGRWNKFTSPTPTERARRVLGRAPGFRRRRRQHLLQRGGSD